jgi:aldehyde dehydrogenase (NAD+)
LLAYLNEGEIIFGGKNDATKLFIEPTILQNVPLDARVMTEEIFGPILPIFTFTTQEEALKIIQKESKPIGILCIYCIFKKGKKLATKSTIWWWLCKQYHLSYYQPSFAFGGVGYSGLGSYHGQKSFEIFTHAKPV